MSDLVLSVDRLGIGGGAPFGNLTGKSLPREP